MTDYKTIKGKKIKFFTSDLTNSQAEGQVYYLGSPSAAGDFKTAVVSAAWSSGSRVNSSHLNPGSGSTPRDAGIIFGGFKTPASSSLTEEFNGNGWTENGNMNTARQALPGFGTQTSAVGAGGYINGSGDVANVEEYNGSSWTEVNNIPSARRGQAGFGTLTAGVICGGVPNSNQTFEYDGTNWTSGGNLGTGMDRTDTAGAGTLTAGLVAAGDTTESFTYNGTAWTDVGTTNSPHDGGSDTGLQTAAVVISGFPAPQSPSITTACETFDGTSFSTTATVAQGAYGMGNGGASGTAAFKCTGDANPGTQTGMEEFNITINTVTAGAWASGGALPSANNGLAGAGVQTAALGFGSRTSGQTTETYEYDGSSWTSGGDINYAAGNSAGLGTQTAAVSIGGGPGGASNNASSSYDGSSWTANNTLNGARSLAGGAGTSTAGLANGGFANPPGIVLNTSEHWDGTNWTTSGNMNTARMGCSSAGTQTNAVTFGGINYPAGTYYANSEDYNGSSWTAGASMNAVRNMYNGGDGVAASAAWAIAGDASSNPLGSDTNYVELYNETVWVTQPPLATGRRSGASTKQGTSSSTLFFGGRDGSSDQTITEEFTGESTSLNLKTITDS